MLKPGDILSYLDMCRIEGTSLQRGMNFRLRPTHSVVLMSQRAGAPYADRVEEEGRTLVYEGHDVPRSSDAPVPKELDQPAMTPGGKPTQNGLFSAAAHRQRRGTCPPEKVRVYEKIKTGIWVYNGVFDLVDAWTESSQGRQVFKFRLELSENEVASDAGASIDLSHTRMIPTQVKLEVWKRDGGKCVLCDSTDNLHFDHDIPFSKGGSSLVAANIQLMCARHNLAKHDNIQ
ncbi:MAG TPA: HNH endonuclease [Armatimonadota bacterium]|jgi:hypothetical protein